MCVFVFADSMKNYCSLSQPWNIPCVHVGKSRGGVLRPSHCSCNFPPFFPYFTYGDSSIPPVSSLLFSLPLPLCYIRISSRNHLNFMMKVQNRREAISPEITSFQGYSTNLRLKDLRKKNQIRKWDIFCPLKVIIFHFL